MQIDKVKHFLVCWATSLFTGMLMIATGCNWWQSAIVGFMTAMALGVGKEYGDSKAQGNYWDWWDILADAVGALLGCSVILLGKILTP